MSDMNWNAYEEPGDDDDPEDYADPEEPEEE